MGIDIDRSSISTVLDARQVLGALDLEVLGFELDRRAAALAPDRIADRALEVELERVAEFVRLGLVRAFVPETLAVLLVLAEPLLGELGEQVARARSIRSPADRAA